MTGNSITPITGSDNKIWKVSACSYFPSFSIRTRHVALVCPGLNWICRWDLPLKSSSFFALPSWVPIPERWRRWWAWKRRNRQEKQTRWVKKKQKTKERRQRKWQWKGDRRERETDDKQIRYSHPLMLFREVRKRVLCFFFFFSTDHYSASMCEMNLWLKDLNKHILAYWDGLATIVVRYAYMNGYMCVCASRPFPFKCRSLRLSNVFHVNPLCSNPSDIHACWYIS